MAYYGQLSPLQSCVMAIIIITTNFPALLSVVSLWKKEDLEFEAIIILLSMLTSIMYHLCEVVDSDIYLSHFQWHRLDNIFAISCSSIFSLHILGNAHARKIVYSTLMVSMLAQEKDPWGFQYTFGVIFMFAVFSVILRIIYWSSIQIFYEYKKAAVSVATLGIGGLLFLSALDFKNDYLKFKHGLWHLFAYIAIYYGMGCVTWKPKYSKKLTIQKVEPSVQQELLCANFN